MKQPHINSAKSKPAAANSVWQLFGHKDFSLQMLEKFPFPIEVFSPDGTLIFVNPIFLKLYNIQDSAQIVGKYNLLCDPLCFVQPYHRELFRKAFKMKYAPRRA